METLKNLLKQILIIGIISFVIYVLLGRLQSRLPSINIDLVSFLFLGAIFLLVQAILTVLVHEGGHIFFGRLNGYKLVMFTFFDLVWINREDTSLFKRQNFKGTIAQALLVPPLDNEDPPYVLYNLGGIIFNGLMTIAFLLLIYSTLNIYIIWFALIGVVTNVYLALINIIPADGNDGYTLQQSLISKNQRKQIHSLLWIYYASIMGESFKEIQRLVYFNSSRPLSDNFNASMQLIYVSYLLEEYRFDEAKAELQKLMDILEDILDVHKSEIVQNYLFTLLLTDPDNSQVVILSHHDSFEAIQKMNRADLARIEAAEAFYRRNEILLAQTYLLEGRKLIENIPTATEQHLETRLYDYVQQDIDQADKEGTSKLKNY